MLSQDEAQRMITYSNGGGSQVSIEEPMSTTLDLSGNSTGVGN